VVTAQTSEQADEPWRAAWMAFVAVTDPDRELSELAEGDELDPQWVAAWTAAVRAAVAGTPLYAELARQLAALQAELAASQVAVARAAEIRELAEGTAGENARLLSDLAAACSHRDLLAAALARIEGRTDGYDPGTNENDIHEFAAAALALRAGQATGRTSAFTEWAVFHGGEHPDDCAGVFVYDDEADCEEHLQLFDRAGIAKRTVSRGPWTVTRPPQTDLAPGEDPDDNLTEAEREEYLRWRAEKGLSS